VTIHQTSKTALLNYKQKLTKVSTWTDDDLKV
jgi:hypothetical protein